MTTLFGPRLITRPNGYYSIAVNENEEPHVSFGGTPEEANETLNDFILRYNVIHDDDGTHRLRIYDRATGTWMTDITVDAAHHALDLIQDDHLAHLDNRGLGDDFAEHRTYSTQDEAIRAEIIEPIESSQEDADTYDLDAIAVRVLATKAGGYACVVDSDRFWEIVEDHGKDETAPEGATSETAKELGKRSVVTAYLARHGSNTRFTLGTWSGTDLPVEDYITVVVPLEDVRRMVTGPVAVTINADCVAAQSAEVRKAREEEERKALLAQRNKESEVRRRKEEENVLDLIVARRDGDQAAVLRLIDELVSMDDDALARAGLTSWEDYA